MVHYCSSAFFHCLCYWCCLHTMQSWVFITVRRLSVHRSVRWIDSSNGSWRVCCWVPASAADIDCQLWAACCMRRHSAVYVGSIMLRAHGASSMQTGFNKYFSVLAFSFLLSKHFVLSPSGSVWCLSIRLKVAYDFNCCIKTEEFLRVTGSYILYINCNTLKLVQNRHIVTADC